MRNEFGYLGDSKNDGLSFGTIGTVEERWCGVCGTKCAVLRNESGPTCFSEAVARRGHPHDTFSCPYYGAEWHMKTSRLIKEWRDTNSKRLRALIELDLDELLEENLPPDVPNMGESRETWRKLGG